MKTIFLTILFLFLLFPTVIADDENCSITHLDECFPDLIYDTVVYIINLPLLPLLLAIEVLLTTDASTETFYNLWSIVRYILSFFYLFFFLYVGYTFLISNSNPIKRMHAKDMLKNTFLMIILIQASYFIYDLLLELSSIMNEIVFTMIDPSFFTIAPLNILIAIEIPCVASYLLALMLALLFLVLRYLIVSFGVILFPIGLFLYFIPPLKGYGRFILNVLAIFIFITFIDLLIILACSLIVDIGILDYFEILVMSVCFFTVSYTIWLSLKFAMKMAAASAVKDDIKQLAKYIAMVV